MNYDNLHFIMVFNVASQEQAKELATKLLTQYGVKKFQNPDWFRIGSVSKVKSEKRWRKELTAYDSNFPWNAVRANKTVNKWIEGRFTESINELVDRVDHGKTLIGDLRTSELKVITRHYENRLEANRFRKANNNAPFDMLQGHEFNAGKFNEFGVTQLVNSTDGDMNFVVAVYCNLEQFKY